MPPLACNAARLLVIDDDRDLLDLLGLMLRGAGYDVVKARDEAAALAAVRHRPPDLIISDFRLHGDHDGLELADILRVAMQAITPRTVPFILLTGDISVAALARFAATGCPRLSKPVLPATLLAAVAAALTDAAPTPPDRLPPPDLPASIPDSMFAVSVAVVADASAATLPDRVHVIDDDPGLLRELSDVLTEAGLPCRLHASSEAFRAHWTPGPADCLLVDAYLPGESGLALLRALTAAGTLPPAVMITGRGDVAMAVEAMKAGALDFIEKPASGEMIVASIRKALAKGRSNAEHTAEREANAARLAKLTARQRDVMLRVLRGHPSKNIAADLGLSQRTVENHRAEIMRRTGCRSVPALARLVMTADPDAVTKM